VPNGDIRLLANASRGWARAVVDLTVPGSSAVELDQVRQVVADAAHRVAQRKEFVDQCTEPPVLVGFVAADATTFTLRVTLHTVPSQRDALTRALREETIVELAKGNHWPAEITSPT
jgi:small conductance mechanosensitive channel